ncbi:MAG: UDP-N-acetylglucosamine--N-acetylmuramyl-(pentapeptide) pyrophosphoryl-undecaprenol N-acetylglucosamine transferase [Planctomycetota bacterium]
MRRIGLVSSGTGGHLWPALTLGSALERHGHETVLLTEGRQVERDLLSRAGREADYLPMAGRGPKAALGFAGAVLEARRWIERRDVDALVLTGGRTALAAGLAGRSRGVPIYLLEQNVVRGRSNKLLAPLARRVYQGLPQEALAEGASGVADESRRRRRRLVYTGTPLRENFLAGHAPDATEDSFQRRARARERLGLPADRLIVFVTGGSQGASSLNDIVPEALALARRQVRDDGLEPELFVCHLCGPDQGRDGRPRVDEISEAYDALGLEARVEPLTEDMPAYYAAADLVVCRGGGVTIAELIATGRAAVVLPYPFHQDRQQWHNARVLEIVGAARIVEERVHRGDRVRLTEQLVRPLGELLADRELRARMECAAVQLDPGDASERIIQDLHQDRRFGAAQAGLIAPDNN